MYKYNFENTSTLNACVAVIQKSFKIGINNEVLFIVSLEKI